MAPRLIKLAEMPNKFMQELKINTEKIMVEATIIPDFKVPSAKHKTATTRKIPQVNFSKPF